MRRIVIIACIVLSAFACKKKEQPAALPRLLRPARQPLLPRAEADLARVGEDVSCLGRHRRRRLTTQGFGGSQPVARNETPDRKEQNRRVELAKEQVARLRRE
jgi:hypothetical protein